MDPELGSGLTVPRHLARPKFPLQRTLHNSLELTHSIAITRISCVDLSAHMDSSSIKAAFHPCLPGICRRRVPLLGPRRKPHQIQLQRRRTGTTLSLVTMTQVPRRRVEKRPKTTQARGAMERPAHPLKTPSRSPIRDS